ncbi:MAG: hypothetical protein ACK40M_03150 [Flavobacteriales bacterium]
MSHDNHGHDHGHDHGSDNHGSEHIFFDGGGVAGVSWIYMLAALGILAYMVFAG